MDKSESVSSSATLCESMPDKALDLATLPPIYVSATHFESDSLHKLEDELVATGAQLTYDVNEARIVLSKVVKKARLRLDFRSKGLAIEEIKESRSFPPFDASSICVTTRHRVGSSSPSHSRPPADGDDSTTASESDGESRSRPEASRMFKPSPKPPLGPDEIAIVRVEWFDDSRQNGKVLPLERYLTLQARKSAVSVDAPTTPTKRPRSMSSTEQVSPSQSILKRAREDAPTASPNGHDRFGTRKFGNKSMATPGASWEAGGGSSKSQYAHLLHANTSDIEDGSSSDMLEMPDWVLQRTKYACQRATPRTSPNSMFIELLKEIKTARQLAADEIGVRAYSTSIASLAAYPYKFSSPREILALPGCEVKIANLFVEWTNYGKLKAVEDLEADEELQTLRLFYNIWGVGSTTAREFFYDRGWRDLDDIVELGWKTLSRVQQIGVKFYDEFLDPIPHAEVQEIGRIIHRHAVRVRDDRIQSIIVGGHRRGKEASGDVDVVISHPDEDRTLELINDIVASLEDEGWITHTLLLSLTNTHREQKTLPFRSGGGGHGFDSLDKALVVWQDPSWPSKEADLAADPKAKNPNIHRRVDIIISPWRTVGCAVVGWSGGTTFQRDLRRYAKIERQWKFDSSGVRSRINGEIVDVEGYTHYTGTIGTGRAKTMEEAEKRVFEGLDLVYREPWDRCTG